MVLGRPGGGQGGRPGGLAGSETKSLSLLLDSPSGDAEYCWALFFGVAKRFCVFNCPGGRVFWVCTGGGIVRFWSHTGKCGLYNLVARFACVFFILGVCGLFVD